MKNKNSNKIKLTPNKITERSNNMEKQNIFKQFKVMALAALIASAYTLSGCGDTNVTGTQESKTPVTASGEKSVSHKENTSNIFMNISLKFKSETLEDSKFLESNNGTSFNNIVSIKKEVKPGEEIDLQELQPNGIFGIYLQSNGTFSISNSDGMNFSSKTILIEKCSFIDLKLRNTNSKSIFVSGLLAGE